jgi:AraC-like DNA-binding protein
MSPNESRPRRFSERANYDRRVHQIVQFVEVSLSDPKLRVENIAAAVHLSPSRLRYVMQHSLGQSPKQFLLSKRLLRAETLLQTSFMSIKEVMVSVGMNDPTNFSREFKKMFGLPPSEYRDTMRPAS